MYEQISDEEVSVNCIILAMIPVKLAAAHPLMIHSTIL